MTDLLEKENFQSKTIEAATTYCDTIILWASERSRATKNSFFKLSDCKQSFMTVNEMLLRAACCILARDGKLRWIEKARILTFEVINGSTNKSDNKSEIISNSSTNKKRQFNSNSEQHSCFDEDKENEDNKVKKQRKLPPLSSSVNNTNIKSCHENILSTVLGATLKRDHPTVCYAPSLTSVPPPVIAKIEKQQDMTQKFDLFEYEIQTQNNKKIPKEDLKLSDDIKVHFESKEEKQAREDLHLSFDRSHDVYTNVMHFVSLNIDDEFHMEVIIAKIQAKYLDYSAQEIVDAMKTLEKFNKIMFLDEHNLIKI